MSKKILFYLTLFIQAPVLFGDADLEEMPILDFPKPKTSSQNFKEKPLAHWNWDIQARSFESDEEILSSMYIGTSASINQKLKVVLQAEFEHHDDSELSYKQQIHEGFMALRDGAWDLSIGLKKVKWGQMDFVSPANLLAPLDLSEGLSAKLENVDRSVPTVQLRGAFGNLFGSVFYRPYTQSTLLPEKGSRWDLIGGLLSQVPGVASFQYDRNYAGKGGRIGARIGSLGMRLSSYAGYESFEVAGLQSQATTPTSLNYHSLDFDYAIDSFVLKGDVAWGVRNRYVLGELGEVVSELEDFSAWAMGFDLNWERLQFIAELSGSQWIEESQGIVPYLEERPLLSYSISYSILNDSLTLNYLGQYGLNVKESLSIFKISYGIFDSTDLELGFVNFSGDQGSLFGAYDEQDHTYLQIELHL